MKKLKGLKSQAEVDRPAAISGKVGSIIAELQPVLRASSLFQVPPTVHAE